MDEGGVENEGVVLEPTEVGTNHHKGRLDLIERARQKKAAESQKRMNPVQTRAQAYAAEVAKIKALRDQISKTPTVKK